jgi:hypothetical protein
VKSDVDQKRMDAVDRKMNIAGMIIASITKKINKPAKLVKMLYMI